MGINRIIYSSKKSDTGEYFVGYRKTASWMAGMSMLGTQLSSITFIAYPADSFETMGIRLLPIALVPVGSITAAFLSICSTAKPR